MRIADSLSRRALYAGLIIGVLVATGSWLAAREQQPTTTTQACAEDNGGITLPAGFCATVFADNIGHARHLVVAPNGVVYVNTWSGRYYGNDTPPAGGFLVALQDTKGEGRADVKVRFGGSVQTGSAGGTGITLYRGALFAEVDDRIVRYKNIGVLIMVMCWRSPFGSLNSSAMPRGLRSASEASGSPPASENRATTGTGDPENRAEREYAAASDIPAKVPTAQVPLA